MRWSYLWFVLVMWIWMISSCIDKSKIAVGMWCAWMWSPRAVYGRCITEHSLSWMPHQEVCG